MRDIEKRKAAALEGLNNCSYIPCSQTLTKEHCETIRELLSPSPPVASGEVDEAVEYMSECAKVIRERKYHGVEQEEAAHIEALIRAAQQPRQEWMTALIAHFEELQKKCKTVNDLAYLDGVIAVIESFELPSPPKETR